MAEPKESAKPIADVAHPDTSLPADTSKPVIITNRPIIKDPMMAPAAADKKTDKPAAPKVAPTIAPLSAPIPETDKPAEAPAEPAAKKPAKPEKVEAPKPPEPEPKPEPEAPLDTEDEEEPKPDEKTVAKAKADDAALDAKQEEAIEKLAESKQYFLPINAVEQRRTKRFIIVGIVLALLLAAAWVNIALDAGLI